MSDYIHLHDHPQNLIQFGDGEWRRDTIETLGPERIERIAQGYECIRCHERFDSAYPKRCPAPWCGFEVAKEQKREFEQAYAGVDWEWVEVAKRAEDAGIVLPT